MSALIQKAAVIAALLVAVTGAWFLFIKLTSASVWWLKLVLLICATVIVPVVILLFALFLIVGSAMCKRGYRRMRGRPLP